jgi:predicted TIM-barrel fold metal-dependent hydrolase
VIIDAHAHIFAPQVIANVSGRPALIEKLHLDVAGAQRRTSLAALREESRPAGVGACLLLPTAAADKVREINLAFRDMAAGDDFFVTAGTLHPQFPDNEEELSRLFREGVRAIKLCSFSQGFSVPAAETQDLFRLIEDANRFHRGHFFVIIDTLYLAHADFGTAPEFDTTPAMLGDVVKAFPGVNFVLAHMGGLTAPREEIFKHLTPAGNLYLDTSGAAYTLSEEDFGGLLKIHGPDHIIFGTDWPWFGHRRELEIINVLLDRAGFGPEGKQKVFCRNAAGLLGMPLPEQGK